MITDNFFGQLELLRSEKRLSIADTGWDAFVHFVLPCLDISIAVCPCQVSSHLFLQAGRRKVEDPVDGGSMSSCVGSEARVVDLIVIFHL